MTDELVDVIDEKGEVLKTVYKKDAHAEGLLHKTVISEVTNSKGEWLLVRQSSDKQDAGQYVSPVGGHVSSGETNEQSLMREAEEEIGFKAGFRYEYVGEAIYRRTIIGRDENHLFVMYRIYSDNLPTLNEEGDHYQYVAEEELKRLLVEEPDTFGAAFHFVIRTFFPQLVV